MNHHFTTMAAINRRSTNLSRSTFLSVLLAMAISACGDGDGVKNGGGGGVGDEGGDAVTGNSIPTQPADLVVSSITASPAFVGKNVTLTATISNIGGQTSGNFDVDLYKNLDSPPTVGQGGFVTCSVNSLSGGASTNCSGTVTYPAAGTDIAWAQVDTQNTAAESIEMNNTGQVRLLVMPSGVMGVTAANCVDGVPQGNFFTVDSSVHLPNSIKIGFGTVILAKVTLGVNADIGTCGAIGDGTNSLNIASSADIGNGTTISGVSSIGGLVNVGNTVTLVSSSVAGGSYIGDNSSLSGASLGTNVKLGIGSSIISSRVGGSSVLGINDTLTGATLGSSVHLGNQVTVGNNASIGSRTHVGTNIINNGPNAYLGSNLTTIQHDVFVAGTVKIGIGATIGANAQILNGAVINSGVTIGAGAHIAQRLHICTDVPAGMTLQSKDKDQSCN